MLESHNILKARMKNWLPIVKKNKKRASDFAKALLMTDNFKINVVRLDQCSSGSCASTLEITEK